MSMNIPRIASVETAVRLYYTRITLCNDDIAELFPGVGNATVQRLKIRAREYAAERGKTQPNNRYVLTDSAYEAWGLDIKDLERRYNKATTLGIIQRGQPS